MWRVPCRLQIHTFDKVGQENNDNTQKHKMAKLLPDLIHINQTGLIQNRHKQTQERVSE